MKIMVLLWSTSVVKRIVALSLLSFSLIFYLAFLFFYLSFLFFYSAFFNIYNVRRLIPTCGGIIVSIILSSLGQCSNNEDHHTFIYLQLKNYNSILRTKYDSIWMPPAVYRDVQWLKSDMYERIMKGGFATNTMSTTWSCKSNMTMMERVIINGTMESYMAIYLWMAMEMP